MGDLQWQMGAGINRRPFAVIGDKTFFAPRKGGEKGRAGLW